MEPELPASVREAKRFLDKSGQYVGLEAGSVRVTGGRSHAKDSDTIWRVKEHLEVLSGNVFVVYAFPEACQNKDTDLDTSFRIRTICSVTTHA